MFESFVSICRRECRTLVDDHGFEAGEPSVAGRECSVTYRKSPNVAATMLYEAGAIPVVLLTLRNGPDHSGSPTFEVALKNLMQHRRPGWKLAPPDEDVERSIAAAMRECLRALKEDLPQILEAADDAGPRMRTLMGWRA